MIEVNFILCCDLRECGDKGTLAVTASFPPAMSTEVSESFCGEATMVSVICSFLFRREVVVLEYLL